MGSILGSPYFGKRFHLSYSLNSLKEGYITDYIGTTIGVTKGDTRSLDNGSFGVEGFRGSKLRVQGLRFRQFIMLGIGPNFLSWQFFAEFCTSHLD